MVWDGVERRNFVRADFPCKITIYTPAEHMYNVYTENIGEGGIAVIFEEKLPAASLVGLNVFIGKNSISCTGRVVWAVDKRDGSSNDLTYDTGIEFYDISDADRKIVSDAVKELIAAEEKKKSQEGKI